MSKPPTPFLLTVGVEIIFIYFWIILPVLSEGLYPKIGVAVYGTCCPVDFPLFL